MALPNLTINMTQVVELLPLANAFGGGILGLVILFIVGFGTLFLTSIFDSRDSLIVSTFITMITALFLKYLGLLGDVPLIMASVLFLAAVIFSSIRKGPI